MVLYRTYYTIYCLILIIYHTSYRIANAFLFLFLTIDSLYREILQYHYKNFFSKTTALLICLHIFLDPFFNFTYCLFPFPFLSVISIFLDIHWDFLSHKKARNIVFIVSRFFYSFVFWRISSLISFAYHS